MSWTRYKIGITLCVALWAAPLGCGNDRFSHQWDTRYLEAARDHDAGRVAQAHAHYAQLVKHAPDTARQRQARYYQATLWLEHGERAKGLAALDALWREDVRDDYGARALYTCAEAQPDVEARVPMWRALIKRYPSAVAAEHALHDLRLYHRDRGQPEAFLQEADDAIVASRGEDLEDFALWHKAQWLEKTLGRPDDALATYRQIVTLDPDGALADDAIWAEAQLHERAGDYKAAIKAMQLLLKDREASWFVGTYDSEFADQARFRIGVLQQEKLAAHDEAIRQFELFISEFPTSRLGDDAAWRIVQSRRLSGQPGWRDALSRFVEDYPESRWTARLRAGEFDWAEVAR